MRHLLASMLLASFLLAGAGVVQASDVPASEAEASLAVRGTIQVDEQGAVTGHEIRDASSHTPAIIDLVAQLVPGLRFEPVLRDGQPVAAQADMNLVLVARKRADGGMAVALRSAWFGAPGNASSLRARERHSPKFPELLMRERVSGTVFAVMRVTPDGRVTDVVAEQVNLRKSGSEREMTRWRRDLARATTFALRRWAFEPFVPEAGADATSVRVPVDFILPGTAGAEAHALAGRWDVYLPGPREVAPWLKTATLADAGLDAVPEGVFQPVGSGLKLLTPLNAP